MKLLQITEIGIYGSYYLRAVDDKQEHKLIFEFYNLEEKPRVGDYLIMPPELLDRRSKSFSQPYAFSADLQSRYGRDLEDMNMDTEIAVLTSDNRGILLKRLYG